VAAHRAFFKFIHHLILQQAISKIADYAQEPRKLAGLRI
jgi:hypothetical protein